MGRSFNALVGLASFVFAGVFAIALAASPAATATPAETGAVPFKAPDEALPEVPTWPEDFSAAAEPLDTSPGSADVAGPESEAAVLYRVCRVTAYCDRGTTASGVPSGMGQCAAPADIPFGSIVYIPALDQRFVVTDRTHRRFRRGTVDIFMPNARQCRNFGRHYLECEITLPSGQTLRAGR